MQSHGLSSRTRGLATDGRGNRILDIKPTNLHQRVPFFVGSRKMVETAENFMQENGEEAMES